MNDLKKYSDEEIIKLIQEGKVEAADLTDSGICPTCFDREHDHCLYGDNTSKTIYEDDQFECFLVGNPRCEGHTAISTKKHFKDMMEADPKTIQDLFVLAQKMMIYIREVYQAESVYLCTMCDGPMNHFHVQLIPRYEYEKRGSKNFVKPRMEYHEDPEKIQLLRKKMEDSNGTI